MTLNSLFQGRKNTSFFIILHRNTKHRYTVFNYTCSCFISKKLKSTKTFLCRAFKIERPILSFSSYHVNANVLDEFLYCIILLVKTLEKI